MGFPFNEQLPNVGRVNEDYTFTIANTTYKSNSHGEISYEVENLPSWLSFDSSSRTFSGKPEESDVGEFEITLTGTDSSDGSQLTNSYSMIVSNDTGLYLTSEKNLFNELAQTGQTNGVDGLVVKPGDTIKIQFNKNLLKVIHQVIVLLLLIMVDLLIVVLYQIGYLLMVMILLLLVLFLM